MPPGYEQYDEEGRPFKLCIRKPIYGIPQAGRRFQRSIFPWLREQHMRQLDESDSSVWVYDPDSAPTNAEVSASLGPNETVTSPALGPPSVDPPPDSETALTASSDSPAVLEALAAYHTKREGKERLVLGVYVDNLQIIHSLCLA